MTVERTLGELMGLLPPNFYLKCQVELDEEGERQILGAVIMEEPPEDGWTIPTYFDEPPGVKRSHDEAWLERFRYDDVARIGISSDPKDPEAFERLTRSMLESFLEKKKLLTDVLPPQVDAPVVMAEPVQGPDPRTPKSLKITVDKHPFSVWVVPGQTVLITAGPHTITFQVPS